MICDATNPGSPGSGPKSRGPAPKPGLVRETTYVRMVLTLTGTWLAQTAGDAVSARVGAETRTAMGCGSKTIGFVGHLPDFFGQRFSETASRHSPLPVADFGSRCVHAGIASEPE